MAESARSPTPVPGPLVARNPLAWLALFGPGAIIASLTIGTGELIFSTRGGALFGYRILFLFLFVSLLKWVLVFSAARQMVLSGAHPYRRMMDLPGPRGWLTLVFFLLAIACLPIWVSFHCGVTGNFLAWITNTQEVLHGGADYLWGTAVLLGVIVLVSTKGYAAMERIQIFLVIGMLACAIATLILYKPDWVELIKGALLPQTLQYPEWLSATYPEIARHSIWVETSRYVGVIGGASYDYLAYASFLREKNWGNAAAGPLTRYQLDALAADAQAPARSWVRAPLVDLTLSFLLVVAFSAVFVASGAIVLAPQQRIPDESHLLDMQAEFVTSIHPALLPLYVVAVLLTMLGTAYGTVEVACAVSKEIGLALLPDFTHRYERRIRSTTVAWCSFIALVILATNFVQRLAGGSAETPRLLLAILTPANLFSGVLGCGVLCALNIWVDRRYFPPSLWMPRPLALLNAAAAILFVAVGIKGYYDHESRYIAVGGLAGVMLVSFVLAYRRPFR